MIVLFILCFIGGVAMGYLIGWYASYFQWQTKIGNKIKELDDILIKHKKP